MAGAATIDWSAPWLQPLCGVGMPVAAAWRAGGALHEALNLAGGAPVRFVPQAQMPSGSAYEQFVFDSGDCPVRDNLHDFFNGLCWLHWPQTKTRLNALQAAQIAQLGITGTRGAVRDAITVFDENAALLQAPDALWQALAAKDWRRLFGELRPLWAQARLRLFGHALLEQLLQPRKNITAHVVRVPEDLQTPQAIDTWLAADLTEARLAGKPFAPLPVLGVPGWWPANEAPLFYSDASVFRPPRSK